MYHAIYFASSVTHYTTVQHDKKTRKKKGKRPDTYHETLVAYY